MSLAATERRVCPQAIGWCEAFRQPELDKIMHLRELPPAEAGTPTLWLPTFNQGLGIVKLYPLPKEKENEK